MSFPSREAVEHLQMGPLPTITEKENTVLQKSWLLASQLEVSASKTAMGPPHEILDILPSVILVFVLFQPLRCPQQTQLWEPAKVERSLRPRTQTGKRSDAVDDVYILHDINTT